MSTTLNVYKSFILKIIYNYQTLDMEQVDNTKNTYQLNPQLSKDHLPYLDCFAEKQFILNQIELQKQKITANKSILIKSKIEENKLDQDCLRYAQKINKTKEKISQISKNIGNTDYFLQSNPHFNQLIQQIILEKSAQEGDANALNVDNMSYQQLLELGQQIGKVSRGLTQKETQELKKVTYQQVQNVVQGGCSVCCQQYKVCDNLILLGCLHSYHQECLMGWVKNQKVCPLCKSQIS